MSIQLGHGPLSNSFSERDVYTFNDACEWVRALPYKRNSTKEDKFIVLKEACGTCSSKHELIKRLAEENKIDDCVLVLCMFKMSGYNTPKGKSVLDAYGLEYIPEAHTYIVLGGEVNDLTFSDEPELLYLEDILFTEEISADQIRGYKVKSHKAYLKKWGEIKESPYTFEELWGIREECIGALSLG